MKKKYRDIIVNNKKYAWTYSPNDDKYEGGGELKIWQNKKVIYKHWIESNINVTPSYIADLIPIIEDFRSV